MVPHEVYVPTHLIILRKELLWFSRFDADPSQAVTLYQYYLIIHSNANMSAAFYFQYNEINQSN